ncbi:hypothetical protein BDZ94DRAFT_1308115 [Collybia nuda]|uniref:Uncharacterized protein n=1 Tax=Collybia nuda TaxID=64659 RepID=A0A9P5Y8Z9_9AGAR|nr:hypothetical protein BDZ94DRAFT_1308115 [Collybia nuda]
MTATPSAPTMAASAPTIHHDKSPNATPPSTTTSYWPTLDDHSPIMPTSLCPLSIYGLPHPMVTPPLPLPPIPSINPTDSPPTHFGTSNSWSNVACRR